MYGSGNLGHVGVCGDTLCYVGGTLWYVGGTLGYDVGT